MSDGNIGVLRGVGEGIWDDTGSWDDNGIWGGGVPQSPTLESWLESYDEENICESGGNAPARILARVALDDDQLSVGGTTALIAYDHKGQEMNGHPGLSFGSSAGHIAEIDIDGGVTAKSPGTARLVAQQGTVSLSKQLRVTP